MLLEAGTRVGRYRLVEKIGEGGMGVVWRAVDTTLDRTAALKTLPPEFGDDPERLSRLRREAKILATLSHPAIAAVYGLEEVDGQPLLAMELVEGEELAAAVQRSPLSVEEARGISIAISTALETAHAAGIVHRDLKPANIVLGTGSTAKVLDFGLAKIAGDANDETRAELPTLSFSATQAGSFLGTAAYASPEQARGEPLDRRTDIWAFGCVLFEMLVGEPLFRGRTVTDILAAVLTQDPDWDRLPPATPEEMRWVLRRCLNRDANERLRDIGEARVVLGNPDLLTPPMAPPAKPEGRAGNRLRSGLLVGLGALLVLAAWSWLDRSRETSSDLATTPSLRKFDLATPGLETGMFMAPKISPDGSRIVYRARTSLWIHDLDGLAARELPGTAEARIPFWSPDSAWIGFASRGRLWRTRAEGGDPVMICPLPDSMAGGAGAVWTSDGRILFSAGSTAGIREVPAQGGEPRPFRRPDQTAGEQDYHSPWLMPDQKSVLAVIHRAWHTADTLALISEGALERILGGNDRHFELPLLSPTGHILYGRWYEATGIWAVPFELDTREVLGEPFLIAHEGRFASLAADGTLLYVREPNAGLRRLLRVDRSGQVIGKIGEPRWGIHLPDVSPDGTRVAFTASESGQSDAFVLNIASGTGNRVSSDRDRNSAPVWSPDGARVIYYTTPNTGAPSVVGVSADGTGRQPIVPGFDPTISPDDAHLVFAWNKGDPKQPADLWSVRLGTSGAIPEPLVRAPGRQVRPQFSPDGRFVLYESNESGVAQIYVTSFPEGRGHWQVSRTGGSFPRWSKTGDEVFFDAGNALYAVTVETRPSLSLGNPRLLYQADPLGVDLAVGFAAFPDGSEFVVVQNVPASAENRSLTVVQNWWTEFADRAIAQ